MNYKITKAVEKTGRSVCFMKKSFKLIYGVKFVQNNAVSLHAPGDLRRAPLHQSESWIFAHEDFWTGDNQEHLTRSVLEKKFGEQKIIGIVLNEMGCCFCCFWKF